MIAPPASAERVQKCVYNFEIYRFLKKRPIYPILPYLKFGCDTCIGLEDIARKREGARNSPLPVGRGLTRAPLALQIFHHLLGGGGVRAPLPPSISAPIGRREKRKKAFVSSSKMITKLFQSIFHLSQNCGPQGQKMAKYSIFFAIVKHRFGKTPLSRGTFIARENLKTEFERELNSPSLSFRQI